MIEMKREKLDTEKARKREKNEQVSTSSESGAGEQSHNSFVFNLTRPWRNR